MLAVLTADVVVALAVVALGHRLGERVMLVAALAPLVAFGYLLAIAPGVLDGRPVTQDVDWIPQLGLSLTFRIDGFSLLFGLLVSGIGILVFLYAAAYFHGRPEGVGRLGALLVLFAGAMLGLVTADQLLLLFVCWEVTTVTSYLLVGWDDRSPAARAAALQALLTTGSCGLALLAGLVLLGQQAGTYQLSAVLAHPPHGTVVTVALVLILVGAFAKSAQYPFHAWLPGAMAAPTPVSAYLHSATMVKAGVYVIARFAPAFALDGPWRPLCLTVGLVSLLGGGLRALRQHDLKLLLAFGTVSQLGLMVAVFGVGTPAATTAGVVFLTAHALFKAPLFMVVGMIDHQHHTRDLRALGRPGPGWGPTVAVALAAAASMAAVPLLFGFVAKEGVYEAFHVGGFGASSLVLAVAVAGSVLTVAYTLRFAWGAFHPYDGASPDPPEPAGPAPAPARSFLAPAALLAALGVVLGVVPSLADRLLGAAAGALDDASETLHLAVWHGFTVPLVLSALTLAGGVALFWLRNPVSRLQARFSGLPKGEDGYAAALRGANDLADRVTSVVQNGSLPTYVGTILLVSAVLPAALLLAWGGFGGWPEPAGTPIEVALAALMLVGALGAAGLNRRMSAALCLGIVGYAISLLFVLEGAPDLALTQLTIETLGVVLFVLVLRRLPERFEHRAPARLRVVRIGVSVLVAAAVFVFALSAFGARTEPTPADQLTAAALPEAGGRNVVNVILVDFRGTDTLGEISVLAVAGLGVIGLVRVARRRSEDRP